MCAKKIKKQEKPVKPDYFEEDDLFCPFKDIKLVPKKAEPAKAAKPVVKKFNPAMYDMYGPSSVSIVRKNEEMPFELLLESTPQASLDLHGKRPDRNNITNMVNEFLEENVEKGKAKVEVVTGRGKHSEGEPVLPGIVKAVLSSSRIVKRFDYAPANRGGEGAFWVILGERRKGEPAVFSSSADEQQNSIKGLDSAIKKAKEKAKQDLKNIKIDYDSYLPTGKDTSGR